MQHINLLWSYDRRRFSGLLNTIIVKAAQMLQFHLQGQVSDRDAFQKQWHHSFIRNLQHPDTLEAPPPPPSMAVLPRSSSVLCSLVSACRACREANMPFLGSTQ